MAPILAATDTPPAQALSAKMKEAKKAPLTLEDCVDLALIISQLSGQRTVSKEYEQLKEDVQEHSEVRRGLFIACMHGHIAAIIGVL